MPRGSIFGGPEDTKTLVEEGTKKGSSLVESSGDPKISQRMKTVKIEDSVVSESLSKPLLNLGNEQIGEDGKRDDPDHLA